MLVSGVSPGPAERARTGGAPVRVGLAWPGAGTGAGRDLALDRGRYVMGTGAVAALEGEDGATVNEAAAELGIGQSGASRFLTQAVERGYLRKVSAPTDAR